MRVIYGVWNIVTNDDDLLGLIDRWAEHRPEVLNTMIDIDNSTDETIVTLIPLLRKAA
jgi:hypothetical protein